MKMTIQQRLVSPTPKFQKKIRNLGLTLAAISASILATPAQVPSIISQAAGYLAVAGSVAAAISQTSATGRKHKDPANGKFVKRG
jgi:hypothetical protein